MNRIERKASSGAHVCSFTNSVSPVSTAPFGHEGPLLALSKKYHTPRRERAPSPNSSLTPQIYLIRPKSTLARARASVVQQVKGWTHT